MPFRSDIDWTAIRRDHELARETEKSIALRHGIAYSAYRRHRDREGWTRDLQPAVAKATDAALIKAAGDRADRRHAKAALKQAIGEAEQGAGQRAAEASLREANRDVMAVQAAAAENVTVITRHRDFSADLFTLAQGIGIELTDHSTLDLPARITCLDRLARTVATIVTIERQAHGLDANAAPATPYEQALRELRLAQTP